MPRKKKEVKEVVESTVVEERAPEETQTELDAKIEAERKVRVEACTKEVSEVLKKYNCDLDAAILLRTGAVMPTIKVVPVELLRPQQPAQ